MGLPLLPSALESVANPDFFWPSRWSELESCPLAVWGELGTADLLPSAPEAVFGTLLHEARKRFRATWGGIGDPRETMKELFAELLHEVEKDLVEGGQPELVPLKRHLEWHRWNDRTKRLYTWATAQGPYPGTSETHAPRSMAKSACAQTHADRFGVGVEPLWVCGALRLKGRPDEVWYEQDGTLAISDFKTGRVTDQTGDVADSIRFQLQLYALMAEALAPGRRVRLFVSGGAECELSWGDQERREVRARLRDISEAHPVGQASSASSLANPGTHCVGCRVRHRCKAYLEVVPGWWPNGGGHPRPLPWDARGLVTSVRASARGWSVWLRDPAGRNVQIEGLAQARPLESLQASQELFLFGLEPAEDVRPHGLAVHPRNFYENAPGPPWRSAVGSRVYSGR
ncbi:RecB family exonuclease [Anaeromyxobacter oryzisoli]|uniref:RecB family exonuclease n=1 Tax=Anaeromyxobacter oryzisoli TaxID=2925408 RepID=UPI0038CC0B2E